MRRKLRPAVRPIPFCASRAERGVAQEDSAGDLSESGENPKALLFLEIANRVLQDDMRNFVGHDGGELRFVGRSLDGAQIHENGPARQGKRVDVRDIDDVKIVRPAIARSLRRQLLSERLHVLGHRAGVRQDRHLLVDLLYGFLAQFDLLLRRDAGLAGLQFDTGVARGAVTSNVNSRLIAARMPVRFPP